MRKYTEYKLNKYLQKKKNNTNGKSAPITGTDFFSIFIYHRKQLLLKFYVQSVNLFFVFTILKSKHFIKNIFGMPMMFCIMEENTEIPHMLKFLFKCT